MNGDTDKPFSYFSESGPPASKSPSQVPPLVLAYVGDAVYEVYIRGRLAQSVQGGVHKLHVEATGYVRCDAQADVMHSISGVLTDFERDIARRGRNAHSGYVPKNANVADYRYATGFEALIGFLYFSHDFDRLNYILDISFQRIAERNANAVAK